MWELAAGTPPGSSSWLLKQDLRLWCSFYHCTGPKGQGGIWPVVLDTVQAANGKGKAGGGKEKEGNGSG